MTTYPKPSDPVSALTRADGTARTHSTDHGRVDSIWENVLHHGAKGDFDTDDSVAIQAAIDTGSHVYFPPGYTFVHSATLIPTSGSIWSFGGMRRYDDGTAGSALVYTGTGNAVDFTNVNNVEIRDGKIEIVEDTAVAIYLQNCNYIDLTRMTLHGQGTTGSSYGIKSQGQVGCQCHCTIKSVQINGFNTGISLSGYSNAHQYLNCIVSTCNTGMSIAATGTDTTGGDDSLFERFEFDSGIDTGLVMDDGATRNVFIKTVWDGNFTTALTMDSSVSQTVFLGCQFPNAGATTDSSTTSTYIGAVGDASFVVTQPGIKLGSSTLYQSNNGEISTGGKFVVEGIEMKVTSGELKVGGYNGSLHSSTGAGIFGNSEIQGSLAIGADLNHDGTKVGFFGVAPATRPTTYAATNVTTDRTYDANATTTDELADVLGTLIADLRTMGLVT